MAVTASREQGRARRGRVGEARGVPWTPRVERGAYWGHMERRSTPKTFVRGELQKVDILRMKVSTVQCSTVQ